MTIISTTLTLTQSLATSQSMFVSSSGAILVDGSCIINSSGASPGTSISLSIYGTVGSTVANAIRLAWVPASGPIAANSILVGSTGVVSSGRDYAAIVSEGSFCNITNFGEITAGGGISCENWSNGTIRNGGVISGQGYYGIRSLYGGFRPDCQHGRNKWCWRHHSGRRGRQHTKSWPDYNDFVDNRCCRCSCRRQPLVA